MKSENQDIWIQSMIDQLNEEDRLFCRPVINRLLELGYTPKKHKKSTFTVSFEKNGRIISKMEVGRNQRLIFWLRFSANEKYSPRFEEAVKRRPEAWIKRGQQYENHNVSNCCGLCKGKPQLYHHIDSEGVRVERCGGYTIMVPGVSVQDVPETLRLIENQDRYFENLKIFIPLTFTKESSDD